MEKVRVSRHWAGQKPKWAQDEEVRHATRVCTAAQCVYACTGGCTLVQQHSAYARVQEHSAYTLVQEHSAISQFFFGAGGGVSRRRRTWRM